MRYTEYEFKVDHFFDILRIICCSLFRAPIQLVNEISKKIVYIEKRILRKVCFGGLVVNLILILINLCYNILYLHRFSFTKGNLPLASLLIGLGFSTLLLLLVDRIKEPKFIEGFKRNRSNVSKQEESVEEIYQEDSLQDLAKIYGSDTTFKENKFDEDLISFPDLDEQSDLVENVTPNDFDFLSKISSVHDETNLKEMLNSVPDIISEGESSELEHKMEDAVVNDKFKISSFVDSFNDKDLLDDLESSFNDMTSMRKESENFAKNLEAKFGYNIENLNQENIEL